MKKMLFSFFVFVGMSLFAQTTIQTQLLEVQNDLTNGGSYKVAIQAKGTNLTASSTIGSATIDVYYNSSQLAPVITSGTIVQGTFGATIGSNYTRSLNNVAGGPYVRLTVAGSNINGNGDGTPAGLDLTSSYQTLVTINFTISDNTLPTNLTIDTGTLTIGLFDSPNNSNTSGTIIPQTMSAPVNISNSPLPVELTSLTATNSGANVKLNWTTATEVNNYGFEVERKTAATDWTKIGFVTGNGNSNSIKEYTYEDNPQGSESFQYRLKQIDLDGKFKYSDPVDVKVDLPVNFALKQNYPNPFNPTTVIKYQIPKATQVSLKVYDILGSEVATLVNEVKSPGNYEVIFDASNVGQGRSLASGLYIYRIQAGSFNQVRKMLMLK